ncbi:MAG TPA: hypothetical protein VLT45_27620, partial [Kofleriaceae bacterium]|nr:hypothetical protein [Kofleriaceae bacterium]
TFTLTKPTDFASSTVHVDGTGAGCEGVVELYGANGREEFNLHPALGAFNQNAPLSGSGEYVLMPN